MFVVPLPADFTFFKNVNDPPGAKVVRRADAVGTGVGDDAPIGEVFRKLIPARAESDVAPLNGPIAKVFRSTKSAPRARRGESRIRSP